MSDFLNQLNVLNQNKDQIIKAVREINTQGVSKSQAQNLREYAAHTESIDELLLYIDYQCVRDKNLKAAGTRLTELIKNHRDKGIGAIRFMLGIFTRWVMIESKKGEEK